MKVLIMSGGKGERFWPKSNAKKPKQFLCIVDGEKTMIQLTLERSLKLSEINDIFVITGERYKRITKEQLPQLPEENILIEPEGKDTAACIGFALIRIMKMGKDSDEPVVILASDHDIKPVNKFRKTIQTAAKIAREKDLIVTIGIRPTRPETGYGYLKLGKKLSGYQGYNVDRFLEKPNKQLAIQYLESKRYLWNAGMFITKPSVMLKEIEKYMPLLYKGLKEIENSINDTERVAQIFKRFEKISIDFGVMEKTERIITLEADFEWDDVGDWLSLQRIFQEDKENNILHG
ncbi:MAG TPA: mannose-1-phosphate guanylyltransferase, partial [Firmicutes bacterium]|nr:mannose-1-phosphate guanylyltransferase [Bacillota bacterium]